MFSVTIISRYHANIFFLNKTLHRFCKLNALSWSALVKRFLNFIFFEAEKIRMINSILKFVNRSRRCNSSVSFAELTDCVGGKLPPIGREQKQQQEKGKNKALGLVFRSINSNPYLSSNSHT